MNLLLGQSHSKAAVVISLCLHLLASTRRQILTFLDLASLLTRLFFLASKGSWGIAPVKTQRTQCASYSPMAILTSCTTIASSSVSLCVSSSGFIWVTYEFPMLPSIG